MDTKLRGAYEKLIKAAKKLEEASAEFEHGSVFKRRLVDVLAVVEAAAVEVGNLSERA